MKNPEKNEKMTGFKKNKKKTPKMKNYIKKQKNLQN